MKKRVVVTGLGVIAANGIGVKSFWESTKNGKSGIGKVTFFDTKEYSSKVAGEVKDFNPKEKLDDKLIKQTCRFSQFALVAAKEAVKDAKLGPGDYDPEKTGITIGTSMGGLDFALGEYAKFLKDGFMAMDTFITSIFAPSSAVRAISLIFQAKGPCETFSSSCVASTNAIGCAFNLIQEGKADVMVAGGTESPIYPPIFAGFCLGRILSSSEEKTPRPFDAKRNGTILGEGSAILILEELEHALKRKAHIYAEVVGYSSTCDAYHVVIPDPEGTQGIRAVKQALENIKLEDVNYISAHGTATTRNDIVETLIIKKVFDKLVYKIPISATKAMTGHLLGASGAMQALISVLAIENSLIPPTINYETADPECDLDYVPNKARMQKINVAVSNSFGFGGFNAVLAFRKYD